MSTYLEICQKVARKCGTVPSPEGKPSSVSNQTGTLGRIVSFVNDVYEEVQNHSNRWSWMETRFSSTLTASVASYNASALGITSRFGRWINPGEFPEDYERQFTIYETSKGQADQGFLTYLEWPDFYARTQVGANAAQTGKPGLVSVDNEQKLHFWPTPDSTGYTVGGPYRKALHTLTEGGDEPEFHSDFHDVLFYGALIELIVFDEAPASQANFYSNKYDRFLQDLRTMYQPSIRPGGPLA